MNVRKAKQRADKARADFEQAVREAHAKGMTTRAIAGEAGLSHQRIHQILHGR